MYKAVTSMESTEHFGIWLQKLMHQDCHSAINIVGAPSSKAATKPTGPSTKEASLLAVQMAKRGAQLRFGAVCIAERHAQKGVEHVIMGKKMAWGAEWFVTQGIYDPEPMIRVLHDYAKLCREQGVVPKKVILTFTPCGRRKTLEFIEWLGMQVPQYVEDALFPPESDAQPAPAATSAAAPAPKRKKAKTAVQVSCDLLCENLRRILSETAGCGVPLGINVESVSGFKDEIDATHDLFRSLQAILLDSTGSPWVVRWSRLGHLRVRMPIHTQYGDGDEERAVGQLVASTSKSQPAGPTRHAWEQTALFVLAAASLGAWAAKKNYV